MYVLHFRHVLVYMVMGFTAAICNSTSPASYTLLTENVHKASKDVKPACIINTLLYIILYYIYSHWSYIGQLGGSQLQAGLFHLHTSIK